MQRIDTPKGNEINLRMEGSREKIALSKKLINGALISFSDLMLNPKRYNIRLTKRMGKKRKKLK
jgi:hypothetical protein